MRENGWYWLRYKNMVGHVVHARFVGLVGIDLEDRDAGELEEMRGTERGHLDLGGFHVIGAPSFEVLLDGLVLTVPCRHAEMAMERLRSLQVRDGGYVKMHVFHAALVLSPEQRDALVASIEASLPLQLERAEQHHREWLALMDRKEARC